jgi:3-phosphoglycerate kinase
MKTIKDYNFSHKKVLIRCDFNVPISEKGEILEEFRIKSTLPTIEHLSKNKAKVILLSHLEVNKKIISLAPVANKLKEIFGKKFYFVRDIIGDEAKKKIAEMKEGEIILLENLRFHQGEKDNDQQFAKALSQLGDCYVNEAFSCSHRKHASIYLLPQILPSFAGFLLEKELNTLSKILKNPERPLVSIIGGIKIDTKMKTILNLLEKSDHLLLGSKFGEIILAQKSILIGREIPQEKLLDKIDLTNPKLHLPVDGRIGLKDKKESYFRIGSIGTLKKEEEIYDIGPETVKIFSQIIKEAKTIFLSGPLGMFEDKRFSYGTREIAQAIVKNYLAFKVAGGGDTIFALNSFSLFNKFDFISTGGGAMLEFLAGEKLPGLEVLGYYGN